MVSFKKKEKIEISFEFFFSKSITLESVEAVLRRRPPQFHAKPFILPIMSDGSEKENSVATKSLTFSEKETFFAIKVTFSNVY